MLFDDPIREGTRADELRAFVLVRQCALCAHGCLDHHWVCSCCQDIERPGGACPGGRESNLRRPLLPPHWPKHARAAGASSDHLTVSIWRGTPPNPSPR
jgi:hypothetical protein